MCVLGEGGHMHARDCIPTSTYHSMNVEIKGYRVGSRNGTQMISFGGDTLPVLLIGVLLV